MAHEFMSRVDSTGKVHISVVIPGTDLAIISSTVQALAAGLKGTINIPKKRG